MGLTDMNLQEFHEYEYGRAPNINIHRYSQVLDISLVFVGNRPNLYRPRFRRSFSAGRSRSELKFLAGPTLYASKCISATYMSIFSCIIR
jgi:hypothetical protein